MKKSIVLSLGLLAAASSCAFTLTSRTFSIAAPAVVPAPPVVPTPVPAAATPRKIEIDLDKAEEVKVPAVDAKPLTPAPIQSPKLKGWVIDIPGDRPIATPAYWDGKLYVGGGYGSYEFYCFDADTGKLVWQVHTKDDGPTAAVVEDGLVAFNTESCTVMVLQADTGKVVWEEWLGDPLMSQPAVAKGKLYIAYPGGQRGKGAGGYRMLCADLKTGKHIWDEQITAEVQSAPVVDGDKVYFTCFDGTAFCLDANSGSTIWKKADAGTSAPVVADGQVVITSKQKKGDSFEEGVIAYQTASSSTSLPAPPIVKDYRKKTATQAAYLGNVKGMLSSQATTQLDSSVGFGGGYGLGTYGDEGLAVKSVAGGWAHQGSRMAMANGRMMNAQGNVIRSYRANDSEVRWQASAKGKSVSNSDQQFSPPALGKKNMYLCSAQGHVLSIDQDTGDVKFMYATNQPTAFQPILVNGNIYVGTSNGKLMCLATGDQDADGWTAWGGNSSHNMSKHDNQDQSKKKE